MDTNYSNYRTRSSQGRGLSSNKFYSQFEDENKQGKPRNLRRNLFNYEGSTSRGWSPRRQLNPSSYTLTTNRKEKPRSTLGRRKSLGFNLKPQSISSQCLFVNNGIEETPSLQVNGDDMTFKKPKESVRNSLFQRVSSLCIDENLYKDRTNLRKDIVHNRFLRSVNQTPVSIPTSFGKVTSISSNEKENIPKVFEKPLSSIVHKEPVKPVEDDFNSSTNSLAEFTTLEKSIRESEYKVQPVVTEPSQMPENMINDINPLEKNEKKHQELINTLFFKMTEYNEMIKACNKKWIEIEEIKRSISQESTTEISATPITIKKSCVKTMPKMLTGNVEFSDQISTQLIAPVTPRSTCKRTPNRKKSVGYTPKSVWKIVNSQMDRLRND